MRRFVASLALATLTLLGGLTYGAHDAAAIGGTITLTVQCGGDPERTTITNNTDAALDLAQFTITSLVSARQGVERLALAGILAPGTAKTYETGPAATVNVVTRQSIYVDTDPNEGARLATPYGPVEVLCSAGSRSLTVTELAPTATVPLTATAGPTTAPPAGATSASPATVVAPDATAPTATAMPTMMATATRPAMATATRPAATRTPAPTMTSVPTSAPPPPVAPTAVPAMPGMPNGGAGGGAQPSGLFAVLLIALVAASGLVARLVLRRR